jgi:hypothetical protein
MGAEIRGDSPATRRGGAHGTAEAPPFGVRFGKQAFPNIRDDGIRVREIPLSVIPHILARNEPFSGIVQDEAQGASRAAPQAAGLPARTPSREVPLPLR